ncbi:MULTISPECIES: D-cysteine desulfhydrase family protein [Psychrilyobacter]|uniref:Pyridoxal-phosphate dependent enzyme n=1 Tax=Psychrilyobacter piezotolerans TaxID=2293438 RepID=A0ABX9KGP0_9FUSO|nr:MULTISPECIES: D-cysteine desulfhydrase family protein [Psychrilyobacter]MCS5422408.1 D-cysteine desulfhydrase family protein [Psychrilyobacter sp. S5]NDI78129.1 D-cysteine desulfhydrase family protein [Psychrilyobacter piezotolerans]RDE61712.1 D-cysteine desulfhydrase family protein [Psychrilyobacter sp. S5]REI41104.1 pyridoxal-phosphate dependent enzyme [Psychrilyobacter piezotolerans]
MKMPKKIKCINMQTPIMKLENLSKELGSEIYIKRDDFTGIEFSGNKVRKLEYVLKDALDQGADTLITCGGIQSNHARATAALAAKLGMKCYLVLRGDENERIEGNRFLSLLLGAQIKFISKEDYGENRDEIMNKLAKNLETEGLKPYIIPEGASNGLGNFGYLNAGFEIMEQEKEMGVEFDLIVTAVGSGSTYGGLFLADKIKKGVSRAVGFNVCNDAPTFVKRIDGYLKDTFKILEEQIDYSTDEIKIIDGYVGNGYGLSRNEEIEFIKKFAKMEGIILDPVYTGKSMYGFYNEFKKGTFKGKKKILFIHTGGLYGIFSKSDLFKF